MVAVVFVVREVVNSGVGKNNRQSDVSWLGDLHLSHLCPVSDSCCVAGGVGESD